MTKYALSPLGTGSRKAYQKPTMKVVPLHHQPQLLAGSPTPLEGSPDSWKNLQ